MKKVHHTENDLINLKESNYNQAQTMKPKGLWYDVDLSWLDWCKSEMPDWTYKNHFKLDIDESKILIIDTKEKLIEFDKEYSKKIDETLSIHYIDWELVATKYSGIEISPYRYDCRMSLFWYYSWDVESGCIWNFDCIKSVSKIEIIEVNKIN